MKDFTKNSRINLKVIPNSSQTCLKEKGKNNQMTLYLKSPPEKNRANKEIIKYFKKYCHLNVHIVSGLKSRNKVLKVIS